MHLLSALCCSDRQRYSHSACVCVIGSIKTFLFKSIFIVDWIALLLTDSSSILFYIPVSIVSSTSISWMKVKWKESSTKSTVIHWIYLYIVGTLLRRSEYEMNNLLWRISSSCQAVRLVSVSLFLFSREEEEDENGNELQDNQNLLIRHTARRAQNLP